MNAFEARWGGKCAACGEWFREGTLIRYTGDDHIVHEDCGDVRDPLEAERPPCPRCFTVPAVNGECGCD